MKKILLFIASLNVATSLSAQTQVLFIGNSYTGYNNLATMVENVAASAGYSFSNSSLTPGGATLYQHSQNTSTYNQMGSKSWDYVVIQAQSQEPSFPNNQVATQTLPYADQLVDSIRSIVPCAQPTFFRTWGRENGDQWNCPYFPPLCTYEGMDSLLHLRYRMMADSNDAYLSPVGSVWKYIRDTDSTIALYTSDGSHPSLAGSYVAACTFFTIFTRSNPLNITFDANLDTAIASTIREATKLVVYDSLSLWNVGNFDPSAAFTHQMVNDSLYFQSSSANYDSLWFDFGDGNGTHLDSGLYAYAVDDMFTVTLYVFKCGQVDSTSVTVQSSYPFSLAEYSGENVDAFRLIQEWDDEINTIKLFDVSGRKAAEFIDKDHLDWLPNGLYIAEILWKERPSTRARVHIKR
jgi:hypothetical protein